MSSLNTKHGKPACVISRKILVNKITAKQFDTTLRKTPKQVRQIQLLHYKNALFEKHDIIRYWYMSKGSRVILEQKVTALIVNTMRFLV